MSNFLVADVMNFFSRYDTYLSIYLSISLKHTPFSRYTIKDAFRNNRRVLMEQQGTFLKGEQPQNMEKVEKMGKGQL